MMDLLNRVETESNNCGLIINGKKTKIIIVDRSNTLQLTESLQRFHFFYLLVTRV